MLTRKAAKNDIERIQEQNRRGFYRRRKPARAYGIGEKVVIRRTQFLTGGKLAPDFMGPYQVVTEVETNKINPLHVYGRRIQICNVIFCHVTFQFRY